MTTSFPEQAAPHWSGFPTGNHRIQPGDGPIQDRLQSLKLNTPSHPDQSAPAGKNQQRRGSRSQVSKDKSNGTKSGGPPMTEHWAITKYTELEKPTWKISCRQNNQSTESDIKAFLEKHRIVLSKLDSKEVTADQRRQMQDLVQDRTQQELDPMFEWRVKSLVVKKKSLQVIIERKILESPRRIMHHREPYRLSEIHDINAKQMAEPQRNNHINTPHGWPGSQAHLQPAYGAASNSSGQHYGVNVQPQTRPPPQMHQMYGQVREVTNDKAPAQHGLERGSETNTSRGGAYQHPAERVPPPVDRGFDQARQPAHPTARPQPGPERASEGKRNGEYHQQRPNNNPIPKVFSSKMPRDQDARRQSMGHSKPKSVEIHHEEDWSDAISAGWDDETLSEVETEPTDCSSESRRSDKLRSKSAESAHHKSTNTNRKESTRKYSDRGSAYSGRHSRGDERHSTASEDDESSSGDPFIDRRKSSHKAKSSRARSPQPVYRQHRRPSTRDDSPRASSRRYSYGLGAVDIQPHQSKPSRKSSSHHREYSIESPGSSPRGTSYHSSSYSSAAVVQQQQHLHQQAWQMEQQKAKLDQEREELRRAKEMHEQWKLEREREELRQKRRHLEAWELGLSRRQNSITHVPYEVEERTRPGRGSWGY